MMRTTMTPEFVELIPKALTEGTLYISTKYATATHLCACGCGTKIVTPLKTGFWKLARHGELVSLYPSIGNWNHPCQSHYFIERNGVKWAGAMSKGQIAKGRARDEAFLNRRYEPAATPIEQVDQPRAPTVEERALAKKKKGWLKRFLSGS
jgi:hypothetical protein